MKNPETIASYFAEPDIHDEKRVGTAGLVALLVALALLVAHGLNAWMLFHGSIAFPVALLIHLAITVVAALVARVFAGSPEQNRFFLLLLITTATLGIFGAAGSLLTILLHYWYMRFAQPFSLWFSSIFPGIDRSDPQRIYDDIIVGRDESSKPYSVIPFMDVIWYGNEAQKRMALSKMTSRFHPTFATAFKKALGDSSNTIRVQAATAISKIENQFVEHLMRLNDIYNKRPNDPIVLLALAEHYDNYAFTGILDIDRERHNRDQALKFYNAYLERRPNDTDVRVKVGRILMRNGDNPERAVDWLRQSIEQGHTSQTLLSWYAEALFASGRFGELRQLSRETKWQTTDEPLQPAFAETVSFWASGNTAKGKRA